MSKALAGKIALVTGSSRGIGAAIAERLASDGASVIVHYGNSKNRGEEVVAKIQAAGGEADLVSADLTKNDGAAKLVKQIDSTFGGKYAGRIDILVNNAGTAIFKHILESADEDFDLQFNLNVRSLYIITREIAKRMAKQQSGRIINIGSALGERVPGPALATYSATKFAVNGLTRGWARDLGALGITVNNVQPGPIDTDLNPADGPMAEQMVKSIPVGRYGKAEEVAEAVAFVALPSSAFINGSCITVAGGSNA
ncbi:MAG: 3-oxoacyl-ACP reductase family protein [Candidatus Sumerlaeota bacterium]